MVTLQQIQNALALDPFDAWDAQHRMAPHPRALRRNANQPGKPRKASVLVLLYPVQTSLWFVLTQRAQNPHDVHSGQISLPGGSRERDEMPEQTALRETYEELGVDETQIRILGELSSLYIPPSDFVVRPFVGHTSERPAWNPGENEVVEVLECSLEWLLDDTHKIIEDWHFNDRTMRVPWYDMRGHKVWGATAIILSELEQRLRHVLG